MLHPMVTKVIEKDHHGLDSAYNTLEQIVFCARPFTNCPCHRGVSFSSQYPSV
jgi:hypothetical protein